MRLTIAYSKIKKRNLVLNNNDTYQRETLLEQPIRQPLITSVEIAHCVFTYTCLDTLIAIVVFVFCSPDHSHYENLSLKITLKILVP